MDRPCSPLAQLMLLLLGLLIAHAACAAWEQQAADIMGTRVRVEVWHPDAARRERALTEVLDEMRRIDETYSPYKQTSELSRLNREAPTGWVPVRLELMKLLAQSARVSKLTAGAFDVTYASAGRYYDYREASAPNDATLRAAVAAIDYRHVELDWEARRVRYRHPATYVDLGGIAKGYAVDRAIAILERLGIEQGAVSAGGDSRIIGDRRGEPWVVGVRHPRRDGEYAVRLPLADTAVSTSGDYERFFERDGVRYHHILDPMTGRSATGSLSVTILGNEAMLTDALSTSVFVLGATKGIELINRLPGIDAIIIDPKGKLHYSDGLLDPSGRAAANDVPAE
ncbi:MAG: FAD:protein FMN transferase [Pseudomonadota bacterium]